MKVKILSDYDVCFDGIKKTCLKKGQEFDCPADRLYILVEAGVVLDPNMEKKDAERKVNDIMETKEAEAKRLEEKRSKKKGGRNEVIALKKRADALQAKLETAEKENADLKTKCNNALKEIAGLEKALKKSKKN